MKSVENSRGGYISEDEIEDSISRFFMPYMDIYFLGRFFKDFDVGDTKSPTYAKNSIIYAGGDHSSLYYKVLVDVIGFKETYKAKRAEKLQCLDIRDIPDPLF